MFVICQNDYPLAVVNDTEKVAEEIRDEIQKRCDDVEKQDWLRNIFIHIREVPIIKNINDIDNNIYWNDWSKIAHIK